MKKITVLFFLLFLTFNIFSTELVGNEKIEHQITCALLSNDYFLEEIKAYIQRGYGVSDIRYYYTDEKGEYQIQILFKQKDSSVLCFTVYNSKNNSVSKLQICE